MFDSFPVFVVFIWPPVTMRQQTVRPGYSAKEYLEFDRKVQGV